MARKSQKTIHAERMAVIHAENEKIVATGECPRCGAGIHRNNSIIGWWQCNRSGAPGFRKDESGESCSWDCFTR